MIHNKPLPTRTLPKSPDLSHLRRQSKDLLEAWRSGDAAAAAEVRRFYRDPDATPLALHDAQLILARAYGFDSWPKLKAYVDGVHVGSLAEAVRSRNVTDVRTILAVRPELVNVVLASNNEHRALHFAVLSRDQEMVRVLLEHGADPRLGISPLNEATTALAIAADREYREIEEVLRGVHTVQRQAAVEDPDEKPRDDDAYAMDRQAVIDGDLEYLRTRHGAGAYLNPIDEEGGLLRIAVDHDRPDVLRILLEEFRLDPDARVRVDTEGVEEIAYTWGMPLYECARHGKHEMARILLEHNADANARVYASGTPLSEAFGQRDEAMIALLEEFGGEPNPSMAGLYRRKDLALRMLAKYGDTVLPDDGFSSGKVAEQLIGAAARGGDAEILALAIDRVDWPHGDPRWYSALNLGFWNHWYGPWCHPEWDRTTYLQCFRMGLAKTGPPNRAGRFGATLLHQIVLMGDHIRSDEKLAFAEAALDAGARFDLRDDLLCSTPLGWACRWGKEEFVQLFLARGADAVEADAEPWARPLAWAAKKGHTGIARLLAGR